MKNIKVALNMSRLSVPEKISRARFIVDSIAANGPLFNNPVPSLASVVSVINALELAYNNAIDGGKSLKAIMHAKEDDLMKIMFDLAAYVQRVANNDEEVVVTAGMSVKLKPQFDNPDFSVEHTDDRGAVRLRVKPRAKSLYRWEVCEDPMDQNKWKTAKTTDVSVTNFGDLDEAKKYWFRVAYVTANGDVYAYDPASIVVG